MPFIAADKKQITFHKVWVVTAIFGKTGIIASLSSVSKTCQKWHSNTKFAYCFCPVTGTLLNKIGLQNVEMPMGQLCSHNGHECPPSFAISVFLLKCMWRSYLLANGWLRFHNHLSCVFIRFYATTWSRIMNILKWVLFNKAIISISLHTFTKLVEMCYIFPDTYCVKKLRSRFNTVLPRN